MKYLLGVLLAFLVFSPVAHADVYGFMDGKFYDEKATLKYFCFMDGKCYDLQMNLAPFTFKPVVVPVVYDACPNISGNQQKELEGMIVRGGNCIYPVTDETVSCSTRIVETSANLTSLLSKFNSDKALLDVNNSSYGSQLNLLTANYNYEYERLNNLLHQFQLNLTCK